MSSYLRIFHPNKFDWWSLFVKIQKRICLQSRSVSEKLSETVDKEDNWTRIDGTISRKWMGLKTQDQSLSGNTEVTHLRKMYLMVYSLVLISPSSSSSNLLITLTPLNKSDVSAVTRTISRLTDRNSSTQYPWLNNHETSPLHHHVDPFGSHEMVVVNHGHQGYLSQIPDGIHCINDQVSICWGQDPSDQLPGWFRRVSWHHPRID